MIFQYEVIILNIKGRLKKLEEVLTVMDQDEKNKIIKLIALDYYIEEDSEESEELYREAVKNMKRW